MRIKRAEPQPESTALTRYREALRDQKEAAERVELAKAELISTLAAAGERTATVRDGDRVYRATYYQAHRTVIDEAGLKKAIGADAWRKITTTNVVLDKPKLEAALSNGELSPEQVGLYITSKPSKPSIALSEGEYKEEEDVE